VADDLPATLTDALRLVVPLVDVEVLPLESTANNGSTPLATLSMAWKALSVAVRDTVVLFAATTVFVALLNRSWGAVPALAPLNICWNVVLLPVLLATAMVL